MYDATYYSPNGHRHAQCDSRVPYHMIERALKREPIGSWAEVRCLDGHPDPHILRSTAAGIVRTP